MQKPSVRPFRSPRERPTGAPQSEREQNRLRSGTSECAITADCGSGRGTSGTETRPAPSRLRPDAPDDAPELRTETDRDADGPDRERDSRPETERRDVEDRDEREEERDEAPEPLRADELSPPRPPAAMPVGGDESIPSPSSGPLPDTGDPVGGTTGARPQVSQ
ncbi:hypothetical protein GCM10010346_08960 [Streptomyces chryseus]|uniref:Uncharacterized protein n=1 Tax=Streptomyces chryseus TaxID=68186 RepID=A0ABQ3DGJ1_9ACTN|nr:hypothetical protein GCM10010346_08960 [Streptomyces chryseus]